MKNLLTTAVADQPETWCHIAPLGTFEYIVTKGGQPVLDAEGNNVTDVQLIDETAVKNLHASFSAEDPSLIDREHWSITTGDSTAMGWLMQVAIHEDGLWGLVRWTDVGAEMVKNRRLRWLSPVWDCDDDKRPIAIKSIALTNTARFRKNLTPVVNKDDGATQTHKKEVPMKELAIQLGLAEDATPEQIAAAVKELQQFKADAEAAKVAGEAETAYAANKDKICNKADFVKMFSENPDAGRAFVKVLGSAAPEKKDPVLNKLEQFNRMPEGAEKDKFQRENANELLTLQRAQRS
ncbi:MAG: hypothetical protein EOM68_12795 [Spirochaetia bacterium]|nr:hypothetical protein [Spirochaetia bacterium]